MVILTQSSFFLFLLNEPTLSLSGWYAFTVRSRETMLIWSQSDQLTLSLTTHWIICLHHLCHLLLLACTHRYPLNHPAYTTCLSSTFVSLHSQIPIESSSLHRLSPTFVSVHSQIPTESSSLHQLSCHLLVLACTHSCPLNYQAYTTCLSSTFVSLHSQLPTESSSLRHVCHLLIVFLYSQLATKSIK